MNPVVRRGGGGGGCVTCPTGPTGPAGATGPIGPTGPSGGGGDAQVFPDRVNYVATGWTPGEDPTRQYTNIQAAIDDVAISWGVLDPNNRALVLIAPGDYSGQGTIVAPGNVDVFSYAGPVEQAAGNPPATPPFQGDVIIGGLDFSPVSQDTDEVSEWRGIRVAGLVNSNFTGKGVGTLGRFVFDGYAEDFTSTGRNENDSVQMIGQVNNSMQFFGILEGFVATANDVTVANTSVLVDSCRLNATDLRAPLIQTGSNNAPARLDIPDFAPSGGATGALQLGSLGGANLITVNANNATFGLVSYSTGGPRTLNAMDMTAAAIFAITADAADDFRANSPNSRFTNDGSNVVANATAGGVIVWHLEGSTFNSAISVAGTGASVFIDDGRMAQVGVGGTITVDDGATLSAVAFNDSTGLVSSVQALNTASIITAHNSVFFNLSGGLIVGGTSAVEAPEAFIGGPAEHSGTGGSLVLDGARVAGTISNLGTAEITAKNATIIGDVVSSNVNLTTVTDAQIDGALTLSSTSTTFAQGATVGGNIDLTDGATVNFDGGWTGGSFNHGSALASSAIGATITGDVNKTADGNLFADGATVNGSVRKFVGGSAGALQIRGGQVAGNVTNDTVGGDPLSCDGTHIGGNLTNTSSGELYATGAVVGVGPFNGGVNNTGLVVGTLYFNGGTANSLVNSGNGSIIANGASIYSNVTNGSGGIETGSIFFQGSEAENVDNQASATGIIYAQGSTVIFQNNWTGPGPIIRDQVGSAAVDVGGNITFSPPVAPYTAGTDYYVLLTQNGGVPVPVLVDIQTAVSFHVLGSVFANGDSFAYKLITAV